MDLQVEEKRKLNREIKFLRTKHDDDRLRISNKYKDLLEDLNKKYLQKENERKLDMEKYFNDKDFLLNKFKRGELLIPIILSLVKYCW